MKKVFLDTNVLLDFLLDRKPFNDDVAEIIEESIASSIQICVSSVTITDANYIIGRAEGVNAANKKTAKLLKLIKVESVGETIIQKASDSDFKDFEDGVQNFCAIDAGHRILVTRNVKDFKLSQLAIMTPSEYLAKMNT